MHVKEERKVGEGRKEGRKKEARKVGEDQGRKKEKKKGRETKEGQGRNLTLA